MSQSMFQPRPRGYTGSFPGKGYSPWANEGCCSKCRQPASSCCCPRECRREPKELLVKASTFKRLAGDQQNADTDMIKYFTLGNQGTDTIATAFVGGSCCVSISVEVAPTSPTTECTVALRAQDAEGTFMMWGKTEQAGGGYRVYEAVIMTKPGATLKAEAFDCTARVRWCEIFIC